MSRRLIAAKSGWGKSWYAQAIIEKNLPEYDAVVVLDYKDEYRGLAESRDDTNFLIVGPEQESYTREDWRKIIGEYPRLILPRYALDEDEWRDVCGTIVGAARSVATQGYDVLVAIDEAHFVAPQGGSYPKKVKGLATTGRGEGASSLWITQRIAELDKTPFTQCDEKLLGGFTTKVDLDRLKGHVEYPYLVHNPNADNVPTLPPAVQADGESIPLRKFPDGDKLAGSEWVYSDDGGGLERRDTRDVTLSSEHRGGSDKELIDP